MAKKKGFDLPDTIYVARQLSGTDNEYLSATQNRDELVDDSEDFFYVGEYRLVDWNKLRRAVEVVKVSCLRCKGRSGKRVSGPIKDIGGNTFQTLELCPCEPNDSEDYTRWTTGKLRNERDKAFQEIAHQGAWIEILTAEIDRRFDD